MESWSFEKWSEVGRGSGNKFMRGLFASFLTDDKRARRLHSQDIHMTQELEKLSRADAKERREEMEKRKMTRPMRKVVFGILKQTSHLSEEEKNERIFEFVIDNFDQIQWFKLKPKETETLFMNFLNGFKSGGVVSQYKSQFRSESKRPPKNTKRARLESQTDENTKGTKKSIKGKNIETNDDVDDIISDSETVQTNKSLRSDEGESSYHDSESVSSKKKKKKKKKTKKTSIKSKKKPVEDSSYSEHTATDSESDSGSMNLRRRDRSKNSDTISSNLSSGPRSLVEKFHNSLQSVQTKTFTPSSSSSSSSSLSSTSPSLRRSSRRNSSSTLLKTSQTDEQQQAQEEEEEVEEEEEDVIQAGASSGMDEGSLSKLTEYLTQTLFQIVEKMDELEERQTKMQEEILRLDEKFEMVGSKRQIDKLSKTVAKVREEMGHFRSAFSPQHQQQASGKRKRQIEK